MRLCRIGKSKLLPDFHTSESLLPTIRARYVGRRCGDHLAICVQFCALKKNVRTAPGSSNCSRWFFASYPDTRLDFYHGTTVRYLRIAQWRTCGKNSANRGFLSFLRYAQRVSLSLSLFCWHGRQTRRLHYSRRVIVVWLIDERSEDNARRSARSGDFQHEFLRVFVDRSFLQFRVTRRPRTSFSTFRIVAANRYRVETPSATIRARVSTDSWSVHCERRGDSLCSGKKARRPSDVGLHYEALSWSRFMSPSSALSTTFAVALHAERRWRDAPFNVARTRK